MDDQDIQFSEADVTQLIQSLSESISSSIPKFDDVVFLGILSSGLPLAQRLAKHLQQKHGVTIPVSGIDVGLYRDDLLNRSDYVTVQSPGLSVGINAKHVILVDDVCFSGRTIRAALNAIMDYGRPSKVELAVFFDRPFRELPIQPNYVGGHLNTQKDDYIDVRFMEIDGEDLVIKRSAKPQD